MMVPVRSLDIRGTGSDYHETLGCAVELRSVTVAWRLRAEPAIRARPPLKVLPWWAVLVALLAIGGSIWLSTSWLLREADRAATTDQRAQLRVDAIRIGLTVGAGTGGVIVLLLAARRQWLAERTQAHQEDVAATVQLDATERRITELYTRAVDQLGHEHAPVRLGGLYALERLADNYSEHRQSVVEVVCAYLRMPFSLDDTMAVDEHQRVLQEREVRYVAQRMLIRHMRATTLDDDGQASPNPRYWGRLTVNLRVATLINFNFSNCVVEAAYFSGAKFIGRTFFDHTNFGRRGWFADTHFRGDASFAGSRVEGVAYFGSAVFDGCVTFGDAAFDHGVDLTGVRVSDVNLAHAWPPGWTVVVDSPGGHTGHLARGAV
jgi:hypothetical protein